MTLLFWRQLTGGAAGNLLPILHVYDGLETFLMLYYLDSLPQFITSVDYPVYIEWLILLAL